MKRYLMILLYCIPISLSYSQDIQIGDSLKVSFPGVGNVPRLIKADSDLGYMIRIHNLTQRPVYAYSELIFDQSPTTFANFDCIIMRKQADSFVKVSHYSESSGYGYISFALHNDYGDKADSMLLHYDMHKEPIPPMRSRDLTFNLLDENRFLDPGEYKFKILLRTKTLYGAKNGVDATVKDIKYVESDWFHFTLPVPLTSKRRILQKVEHPALH